MLNKLKLKGWLLPPFFLTVLSALQYSHADSAQPYFIMDSFSYSETVPIKSVLKGWKGNDFETGEQQWTWSWIELGVRYKQWGIGLVQRYDYDLRFSEDTAELYWRTSNKKPLPVGKEYSIDVEANAFHSTGLRLTFSDTVAEKFNYTLGISYLYANYMIEGNVNGRAKVLNDSDYDYDALVNYYYTEDQLFDRPVEKPKGNGFSIDTEFSYQLDRATRIDLQVRDLFAQIYWSDSPYTEGKATSGRKDQDENEYMTINPVLTGFEGTDDQYVQRLEPRWYVKLSHFFNEAYGVLFQYRYQYGQNLFGVGGAYSIEERNTFSASYWPLNNSVELSWDYNKLQLSLTADKIEVDKSKTIWLSIAYGL